MDSAFVQFGNLQNVRGMEFTYCRGVTPSVCTLFVIPQDNFDPSPCTLTFGGISGQLTFNNCAVRVCNLRKHWDMKWPLWAVHVYDRRWKWRFSQVTGKYNDHLQGAGSLVNARTLIQYCLQALGENNANVSGAPTGVFPYVNWNATRADLALADLCERCACEVVLNPLTDQVEIWQLGVGQTSPTGLSEQTPKYRFVPRSESPSSIEVRGGPSFFQYRLLLESVARGTNLVQSQFPDWLTSLDSSEESWNFPDVASTVGRELALETGWRYYRVKGQEGGGLNIPGVPFAIANTNQYVLQDFLLDTAYDDRTGQYQRINWYVEGDFWPFSDMPSNTSNQVYIGQAKLYPDRNLVHFDLPVFALDSSGAITEPTLYLQCAYQAKDVEGELIGLDWTVNVGGSGGTLILRRPECFAAYTATGNTQSIIASELEAYAELFAKKYANPKASELTYSGIITGTLDGNIAQCTWSIHPTKGPSTQVCEQEELNVNSLSYRERRRREKLDQLIDDANKGPFG